jgi:hypothetical protein
MRALSADRAIAAVVLTGLDGTPFELTRAAVACFTRSHWRSSGPFGRAGGGPTRIAVQQIS